MSSTDLKPENLGTWFKCQREEFELSQGDAAEKLGFSLTTVVRIESGEIPWASISNKPEYHKPIEELFGYYPTLDGTSDVPLEELRTPPTPVIQSESVRDDISRSIAELKQEIGTTETSPNNQGLDRIPDVVMPVRINSKRPCIVGDCDRCHFPVLDIDDYCTVCGRVFDGSH